MHQQGLLKRSHQKRHHHSFDALDIAHIRQAVLFSLSSDHPLNVCLTLRFDLTKPYQNAILSGKRRVCARQKAVNSFTKAYQNLPRTLGYSPSYLSVFECPENGGIGLHTHTMCHIKCENDAPLLIRALCGLFPEPVKLFYKQQDKRSLKELRSHNKLPLDILGTGSFVDNHKSHLMKAHQIWNTAAYLCKSADETLSITFNGQPTTLGAIRPDHNYKGQEQYSQDIHAYQAQVKDMSITNRLRFSKDLQWSSLIRHGFNPDNADNAGWLSRSERQRRR